METLTWHVQIHFLCASVSKVYYIIKSLRDVKSTHILWSTYFAYFHSILKYSVMFWGRFDENVKVLWLQEKMIW
jgi:hypothetical protein